MYRKMKRCTAAVLSLSIVLGVSGGNWSRSTAATEHFNDAYKESADWINWKEAWKDRSSDFENVSITPGRNETELNFAWYSKTPETPKIKLTAEGKKDVTFEGEQTAVTGHDNAGLQGYYSNKVTVTGLVKNTEYYYSVFKDGSWSEPEKYETHDSDSYSFLYVGDPQIGASSGQTTGDENTKLRDSGKSEGNLAARNDAYNWNKVLKNARAQHSSTSFMVSAGDQVNTADNEFQYAGYLGADALRHLAVATTIGNHDSTSSQYSYHYNNPNSFDESDEKYTLGKTKAGTDYYYRYGNSLFIVLDTNNYNCATHENVMKKAIEENKDAKWRFVTFHQDIYGSGYDHSDSDGIVLRTQLTPLMDKYDIDVVLQGHDHTYSRTYQLTNDGLQHRKLDKGDSQGAGEKTDEAAREKKAAYLAENQCYSIVTDSSVSVKDQDGENGREVTDPDGTVYFEANSSTGSKFYNLIPAQQDYIYERSQTWKPSYSVAHVSETAFTLTTYDAESGAVMEGSSTYTIVKEADKKALEKDLESAGKLLDEKENYTFDSAWELNKAVYEAEKVVNNKKAGKAEVEEKAAALSEAVAGLKKKEAVNPEKTEIPSVSAKPSGTSAPASQGNTPVNGPENKYKLGKVSGLRAKASGKGSIKISWKAAENAEGYEIQYSGDKKFTKKVNILVSGKNVVSKKIKGLKKGKIYIRVRAFRDVQGLTLSSGFTKKVKAKVK